jgi:hypothetical protein
MHNLKVFIAESLSHKDFYNRDWEGHTAEEIVRLLKGRTCYRIVLNPKLLRRAFKEAGENGYDVFHLSCHGDEEGVRVSNGTDISWRQLADYFQEAKQAPPILVLSSCIGGDAEVARAFNEHSRRPTIIFGAEATDETDLLTLPGACISWSILYSVLAADGMTPDAFKEAVAKMNKVTPHQFVYRRWDDKRKSYARYPTKR